MAHVAVHVDEPFHVAFPGKRTEGPKIPVPSPLLAEALACFPSSLYMFWLSFGNSRQTLLAPEASLEKLYVLLEMGFVGYGRLRHREVLGPGCAQFTKGLVDASLAEHGVISFQRFQRLDFPGVLPMGEQGRRLRADAGQTPQQLQMD